MPTLKHVHSYVRFKKKFYKCNDAKCTHFALKELVLGKESACPACGHVFILTREALKRATPKCKNCANTKAARHYRTAKNLMDIAIFEEEKKEDEKE